MNRNHNISCRNISLEFSKFNSIYFQKEKKDTNQHFSSNIELDSLNLPKSSTKQIKLTWKNIVVEAPDTLNKFRFLKKLKKREEPSPKQSRRIIDNGSY